MALNDNDLFLVNRDSKGDGSGTWASYKITASELADAIGSGSIESSPTGTFLVEDPEEGDLWYNANNGILYVWYVNTGDSDGQWVDVRPAPDVGGINADDPALLAKYVEVAGDNMTGDLTLGTDKVTLNATTGDIDGSDITGSSFNVGTDTVINTDSELGTDLKSAYDTVTASSSGATITNRTLYCVDTDAQTITLPASPVPGNEVIIINGGAFKGTVVGRSGSNIMGLAEDMILDKDYAAMTFIYIDATNGWRVC